MATAPVTTDDASGGILMHWGSSFFTPGLLMSLARYCAAGRYFHYQTAKIAPVVFSLKALAGVTLMVVPGGTVHGTPIHSCANYPRRVGGSDGPRTRVGKSRQLRSRLR